MIPIIQTRPEPRHPPPPPQCMFCYENYSELVCQFYEPRRPEFEKVNERNGKIVVCECCDHSEEEEVERPDNGKAVDSQPNGNGMQQGLQSSLLRRRSSSIRSEVAGNGEMDLGQRRRKSNELNEISNNMNRNGGDEGDVEGDEEEEDEPVDKVPKLQNGNNGDQKENGTGKGVVVQAGWYGKGYRKYRSRKKKS